MAELGIPRGLFINNRWVDPVNAETVVSIDPSTEQTIAEAVCASQAEVDMAVDAARQALNGEWKRSTPWDRGRMLMRIYALVLEYLEEMTALEIRETGKPRNLAQSAIRQVARYFEFYAGVADKIQGSSIPIGEGYLDFTLREPIGVTAHIVPWNVPLNMMARGIAPALAAGCTAVVKLAESTPLGGLQFCELLLKAGLPAGVVNVINGRGASTGSMLASHPGIDSLTFTGSVATGRRVMKAAAQHVKPVVLELGGKSPILVFEDAEVDRVADEAIKGIYTNTGQYCDAGSRLLVCRALHDAVVERIAHKTKAIRVGSPQHEVDMGPLISELQYRRVMSYVEQGCAKNTLVCGGGRPASLAQGYFVNPTVFTNVQPDDVIAQEEVFGPVLSVLPFDDEDQAVAIANGTDYGLAAGIFSKNIDRVLRLVQRLEAGTVYVNEYFSGEMASPFGGMKKSGIGRERGLETMANYTRIKNVIIRVGSA